MIRLRNIAADCHPSGGTGCPTASQFVSQHRSRARPRQPCWGWLRGDRHILQWDLVRGVTPGKVLNFRTQIPAFWRTFSRKINSCESAKYHTFQFQAALRAASTRGNTKKRDNWCPGHDYDGTRDRGGQETGRLGKNGRMTTLISLHISSKNRRRVTLQSIPAEVINVILTAHHD